MAGIDEKTVPANIVRPMSQADERNRARLISQIIALIYTSTRVANVLRPEEKRLRELVQADRKEQEDEEVAIESILQNLTAARLDMDIPLANILFFPSQEDQVRVHIEPTTNWMIADLAERRVLAQPFTSVLNPEDDPDYRNVEPI